MPVEQIFETAIAVPGEVAVRVAGKTLVELLIGVVDDCTAGVFEPDHVIPAGDFRVPVSGLDDVEFAGDIDSSPENRRQKEFNNRTLRSGGEEIDDLLNSFVGAVVGAVTPQGARTVQRTLGRARCVNAMGGGSVL